MLCHALFFLTAEARTPGGSAAGISRSSRSHAHRMAKYSRVSQGLTDIARHIIKAHFEPLYCELNSIPRRGERQ
jgi:hypothetical protein